MAETERGSTVELTLDQLQRVLEAQLSSYQSIGERASSLLSILTGFGVATLTVANVVAHPPLWAVSVPSALLLAGVVSCIRPLQSDKVLIGPGHSSLKEDLNEPLPDVRRALIDSYSNIIERNRKSLQQRARQVELATWLLLATIASLVAVALALYASP